MPIESRQEELVRFLEESLTPVAVSDLADRFGVTVRTVLRDVDGLRVLGYEIDGTRGRGGGLQLVSTPGDSDEPTIAGDTGTSPEIVAGGRRRPVFVGREQELDSLLDAFGEVSAGSGKVVMLAGEPGIGKTGLVQRVSDTLQSAGAQLYWGRCYESEGALPYWPWVQVINGYASATSLKSLREEMSDGASDIADMVPELHSLMPELGRSSPSETPEAVRFRLFRSVAQFLSRTAGKTPIVLILEDLHWADRPTLLLLEFMAQELADSPVMLIGTYRDVELNRRHPLAQTLAELNRQQNFLRMTLRGLDLEDVGRIIALGSGHDPSTEFVEALYRQTEGNPLFISEMVSLLVEEGSFTGTSVSAETRLLDRVPEGVREAIGRRLDRLSETANAVLRGASVMGREFSIQQARRLNIGMSGATLVPDTPQADGDGVEILPALEEAIQAGIIERRVDELASYQFTHSMIRDTLYDELTTPERVRLHRLAGETIEVLHGSDLDPHLSQLAHHFLEASQGGNPGRAVHYAERAGGRAMQMVAFEEASRLYDMALQALQLSEKPDDLRRCELLYALGRSQMLAGAISQARETHASAAELAKRIGASVLQAESAIAFETAGWHPGLDGEPAVHLLRDALGELEPRDTELKARTLGSLGRAYSYTGDAESALETGRNAIAMARRLEDPMTLATTLWSRLPERQDPSDIHERIELANEAIEICEQLGRFDMAVEAEAWLFNDLLEIGDIDQLGPVLESWATKIRKLRVPVWSFLLMSVEIGTAFRLGHFEEAERLVDSMLAMGKGLIGLDVEGAHGGTMFAIRREQGRLEEVRPALELFLKLNPAGVYRPGLALLYAELDMRDEARSEFERLAEEDFGSVSQDSLFVTTIANMADVCVYLGDEERATVLYRLLMPSVDRNISLGVGHVYQGPVSRYMGSLAAVMGKWSDAELHFEVALEMSERMKSRPQVAHTQLAYAQMLRKRANPSDGEQVQQLLEDAGATAKLLGMGSVAREVDATLEEITRESQDAGGYPAGLSEREVDVIRLLAGGRSNLEIGEDLFITANTVANHVKNILGKTGASNRTEAAAYAVRNDLV